MDQSRLKRILAIIGVIIALTFAGGGLWYVTHQPETTQASTTKPRKTVKRKTATKPRKTVETATFDQLTAKIQEISGAYRTEMAYTPYQSGPYAGMGIYELLEMTGDLDEVDDNAIADEIKTADVMPSTTSPERMAREIRRLQNAYDAWSQRLWRVACDRFKTQSVDAMEAIIKSKPDCMAGAGDPPANERTKASYQAMVNWYENAGTLSDQCAAN